jgi:hypothetical protein
MTWKKVFHSDYNEKEIKIFKIHRVGEIWKLILDMNIGSATYKTHDIESNFLSFSFTSIFKYVNHINLMRSCKIMYLNLLTQSEDILRGLLANHFAQTETTCLPENSMRGVTYLQSY